MLMRGSEEKYLGNVLNVVIPSYGEKLQKPVNFIGDAQISMVAVDIRKEVINLVPLSDIHRGSRLSLRVLAPLLIIQ
jgi:hypothetical protein